MDTIHIFGHENPDTDSICSSIAYANLKQQLGFKNAKAFRLGEINNETKFVLDYFNIAQPEILKNVKIELKSLDLYKPYKVSKSDPIKKAWDVFRTKPKSRLMPAVDKNGYLEGILSMGDITELFMEITDENISLKYEIIFENLLEILNAKIVYGQYNYEVVEGRLIVGSIVGDDATVNDKDIIITSKLETAIKFAVDGKCGCIILTNDHNPEFLKYSSCAIVPVSYNLFRVISLIKHSISVGSIMNKENIMTFSDETVVDEIKEIMKVSSHRNFPVVDKDEKFVGIISRRHLLDVPRKKVILIDHNERGQSLDDIEDAEILEIVDHHRIADVQTDEPLLIRAEPVGCTATIIYKLYVENQQEIPRDIAGIMLSAILSDTLVFNSPTCTPYDKVVAEILAEIVGVSINDYAKAMFAASTALNEFTNEELLSMDCKTFTFRKYKAIIAQVNTLDKENIAERKEGLLEEMANLVKKNSADLMLLMVTDIVLGGSEIIAVGKSLEIARDAFGIEHNNNSIFLEGVVSRKKQVVPKLTAALKRF